MENNPRINENETPRNGRVLKHFKIVSPGYGWVKGIHPIPIYVKTKTGPLHWEKFEVQSTGILNYPEVRAAWERILNEVRDDDSAYAEAEFRGNYFMPNPIPFR